MWWSSSVALLVVWLLALVSGVSVGAWVHLPLAVGVLGLLMHELASSRFVPRSA